MPHSVKLQHERFLKKTVLQLSGATLLGVAVLLFVQVGAAHAQATQLPVTVDNSAGTWSIPTDSVQTGVSCTYSFLRFSETPPTPTDYSGDQSFGGGTCFNDSWQGLPLSRYTNPVADRAYGTRITWDGEDYFVYFIYDGTEFIANTPAEQPTPFSGNGAISGIYNTRFTGVQITQAASGTVDVTAEYFIDIDEIDTNNALFNPTLVRFQYSLRPSTDLTGRSQSINVVDGNGTRQNQFTGLSDGVYDLAISFDNAGRPFSGIVPFRDTYIYTSFTLENGILTDTGTPELYDSLSFVDESVQRPCSITEIGGCIVNAMSAVFYPSQESVDALVSNYTEFQTRAPFIYLYQAGDLVSGLYTQPGGTLPTISLQTGLGEITFLSESMVSSDPWGTIIASMRFLMASGLWIMLFTVLYRKTLRIHDNNTPA